ncbi:NAD(P)/FAD-dependent oxidoreductase [Lewinella sp. 4G2]|uniref:NAD(P)/FAD-dependent oxidoreductase n=1 Tax=Lewinella sp. 4G2 TaxID=1803372 RepID=UPI0007B4BBCD|nr:NAD(P)/FAD-dependent oxidoreductase [Lewinella sp. 4G2]OAV46003.1 pyridine nucleotide-disulfide oxidoreductase [Lewinella sp. 4G2]
MDSSPSFDAIIVGGSYAGLSAAMSLGRSLRRTLIIDGGRPCNRQTPHSHNLITQDGVAPAAISALAKAQTLAYTSVEFKEGLVVGAMRTEEGFVVSTNDDDSFHCRKLIFATGIKDELPQLPGFAECWGITAIHCPYCHGYEVRGLPTGILGNGDYAYHMSMMVRNLTEDLTVFTGGPSTLSQDQTEGLARQGILINEQRVTAINHEAGQIQSLELEGAPPSSLAALYAYVPFQQSSPLPAQLGCALTEQGYLELNMFAETTSPGVYACGDNMTMFRSVAQAIASGSTAGAMVNRALVMEDF